MLSCRFVPCLPFQLQHLVGDDICVQVYDLFKAEQKKAATGGFVGTAHTRLNNEAAYQRKAETLLTDENCFKAMVVSPYSGFNK